jgi:hypothetical protein
MDRCAAEIPGVRNVEWVGWWEVTCEYAKAIGRLLRDEGLTYVPIIPDPLSQTRRGRARISAKAPAICRAAGGRMAHHLRDAGANSP